MNPANRIEQLREKGMRVLVVPRWAHWVTIWRLWQICKKWQPDVLVAHGFSEHLWGRYAGLLAKVPRIVQVEHNVRERYGRWRLWQSRWLARRTDRIVAVSQAVEDVLVRLGHPAERCEVVYNGIDLERWQQGLPWHERETAVVMPARFARQKDHATLIKAAALLKHNGHTIKVYLAGEGKASWRAEAEGLAQVLGVDEHIVCLGHVSDLPRLLGRVKFCVLSTHYEGLGLGLIEGMASGCCGVGTDVEGVREIITHERNGALVPHLDAQGLADVLQALMANPEHAAQLAQAGQAHVRATFDKRRMRQDYIDLFARLYAQPSALRPPV
ncbi:MAG: glycosyltransferase [Burkholderiaceae bacterium]